jgi:Chain length determinant protein.
MVNLMQVGKEEIELKEIIAALWSHKFLIGFITAVTFVISA